MTCFKNVSNCFIGKSFYLYFFLTDVISSQDLFKLIFKNKFAFKFLLPNGLLIPYNETNISVSVTNFFFFILRKEIISYKEAQSSYYRKYEYLSKM